MFDFFKRKKAKPQPKEATPESTEAEALATELENTESADNATPTTLPQAGLVDVALAETLDQKANQSETEKIIQQAAESVSEAEDPSIITSPDINDSKRQDIKAEVKPVVITDAKTEAKPEVKSEVKAEVKQEAAKPTSKKNDVAALKLSDDTQIVVPEAMPETAPRLKNSKEEKKGLFGRMRLGLSKTRSNFTEGLSSLLLGKKEIDDDLMEELETQLIMADV
ncbi:MAG: hypothetical protein P1U57_13140, partial [Oleibacter sp.]|nr:hypothetical protein [Thalassolituus sp.]